MESKTAPGSASAPDATQGAKPRVALLGTGIMGTGMAHALLRRGFPLRVWNRTRAKAEALAADGAQVCDTPAEAARTADVAITMLADGRVTEAVAAELFATLPAPRWVWAQMGTVGLAATDNLARLAQQHGVPFVDAPVLGTKQPAEAGQLTILAAGPVALRPALDPVFEALGQRTLWLAEEPGRASALKLVVNGYLACLVSTVAESLAFAQALGLPPSLFLDTVKGAAMDSPYTQSKGHAMLDGAYEASFPTALTAKDLRLIGEAARVHGFAGPMAEAARSLFEEATRLGHGDQDMAAVFEALRPTPSSRA